MSCELEMIECVGGPADGLLVVPGRGVLLLGVQVCGAVVVHAYELREGKYHHLLVVGTKGGGR